MEDLILMANEIRMALDAVKLKYKIELPRIAVIGAQSSGKSSVLESIVGEDFLPRGTGIVTRWPLILELIHHDKEDKYAEFDHLQDRIFEDFTEVTKEIEERTNVLAGSEKKIVDKPINLKIYSPDVPTLTLVDLPGFTKIVTGDQSEDICDNIEALVMKEIKQENTIILAISPANNDIANSDALQYAKKVDSNGDRTFGVMTKIDIMDNGTDACDYLSGKLVKLKHGFIGVKCRSQDDNNKGKTIKQALAEERQFFATHPAYKDFADTQGTEMLAHKLSALLVEHIRKLIPQIEDLIKKNLDEYSKILNELGPFIELESKTEALEFAFKVIDEYCTSYQSFFKGGNLSSHSNPYFGGNKIYQIFRYFGSNKIAQINPLEKLTDEHILAQIRLSYGLEPGLFIPEEAWKELIRTHIDDFISPCLQWSKNVYSVLDESISRAMSPEITHRKALVRFIQDTMECLLANNYISLEEFINTKIDSEKWYINYDDDDFQLIKPYIICETNPDTNILDNFKKHFNIDQNLFLFSDEKQRIESSVIQANNLKSESPQIESAQKYSTIDYEAWEVEDRIDTTNGLSDHEIRNVICIKRVIHSYFCVLKKEFKTNIPKYIVKFIVKSTIDKMRPELQVALAKHQDLMNLVNEDPEIRKQRDIAENSFKQLGIAMKAIKNVQRGGI